MDTLYEYAGKMMQQSIGHYFELVEKTNNFTDFKIECFDTDYARQMILAGKSQEYIGLDAKQCESYIGILLHKNRGRTDFCNQYH